MASRGPFSPAPIIVIFSGMAFMPDFDSTKLGEPAGGNNSSLGQQRPCLPQFGEKLLVERELQIGRSRTSSSAHADADDALDQLNVAQPPAHHQFVKLSKPLAYINPIAMMVLILVEFMHSARSRFKSLPLSRTLADRR